VKIICIYYIAESAVLNLYFLHIWLWKTTFIINMSIHM